MGAARWVGSAPLRRVSPHHTGARPILYMDRGNQYKLQLSIIYWIVHVVWALYTCIACKITLPVLLTALSYLTNTKDRCLSYTVLYRVAMLGHAFVTVVTASVGALLVAYVAAR